MHKHDKPITVHLILYLSHFREIEHNAKIIVEVKQGQILNIKNVKVCVQS